MSFLLKENCNFKNKGLIIENNSKYEYQDIKNKIRRLEKSKITKGLVLNLSSNCFDFLVGYLFFFESNFPQILLDEQIQLENLNKIIERFKPTYLLVPNKFKVNFNYKIVFEFKSYVIFRTNYRNIKIYKDLGLLLPTSGSTGDQKFAKISFKNILSNTKNIIKYLKLSNKDCTITTLQPSYSYGMSIINTHLYSKASIVLTNSTIVQKEFWDLYHNNKITNFNGVPIMYEIIFKLGLNKLYSKNLKFITSAGGSLDNYKLKKIINFCEKKKMNFFSMYGQTEASPRISYILYPKFKKKLGSIGKSISQGRLLIKNNEIVYRGSNVFGGYSNNFKDLNKFKKTNLLHTGDLGYKDKNSFFYLTGRKKRIAKFFGYRVSLDLLEKKVKSIGYECAVISKNENITIYHLLKINHDKILKLLFKEYKITNDKVKFISIKEIPITKNNKIDYHTLENY